MESEGRADAGSASERLREMAYVAQLGQPLDEYKASMARLSESLQRTAKFFERSLGELPMSSGDRVVRIPGWISYKTKRDVPLQAHTCVWDGMNLIPPAAAEVYRYRRQAGAPVPGAAANNNTMPARRRWIGKEASELMYGPDVRGPRRMRTVILHDGRPVGMVATGRNGNHEGA